MATAFPSGTMLVIVLLLGSAFIVSKLSRIGHRPPGIPPGPPTLPVLGNLHLMPKENPHLQFKKWAEEYGPIYSLILGTQIMIVISNDVMVKELMDKRSGNYSDRPEMYIGQTIASGGLRFVLMKNDKFHRMIRKTIHGILNIKAASSYVPYQDLENKVMLKGFLDTPELFHDHIRRYTFSLSSQIIFGYRAPVTRDPNLQELFWCFETWGKLVAGASAQLTDLFPLLRKLPRFLSPNVRAAEGLHRREKALYKRLLARAKDRMEKGTGHLCFCNDLLLRQSHEGFSDDQAAYICGSLLEAGSDTTASILYGFILALLLFPAVQKKLQAELDHVVGRDRLPNIDDWNNLPYVRCCIKEAVRWMPTIIIGIPHAAAQEDEYRGYRIPAGASVIVNVWAIHTDPERSPEPREFRPERFHGDESTVFESATGPAEKRDAYIFGAARRLCQGIHIAERSLFMGISRLAWAFDFEPKVDKKTGKPVEYDSDDLVGGLTVEPRHYECVIKPRSEERAELIRTEVERDADAFLDKETGQWKKTPEGMVFSTWMPDETYNE